MQNIVNKINILLQELYNMKVQNKGEQHISDHRVYPRDTDEGHSWNDTYLIYNNTLTHLLPYKFHIPRCHAPTPIHKSNTDSNAFMQKKQDPYELLSASPPESLSSSLPELDSKDDNADHVTCLQMKTGQPLNKVVRGEEGLPDPSSSVVTNTLYLKPDPESGCQ